MTKYTKRQYLADIAANEKAVEENKIALENFNLRLEAGESIHDLSDAWNAEHDKTYELEADRRLIEISWNRRNWTWQDHSEHELVMQNID